MIEYERALLTSLTKDLKKLGFSPKMMSAMKCSSHIFCEFSKGFADKTLDFKESYWCIEIQKKCSVYCAKYEAWFEYLETQRENNKLIDNYLNGIDE